MAEPYGDQLLCPMIRTVVFKAKRRADIMASGKFYVVAQEGMAADGENE